MSNLSAERFPEFFEALHGTPPFPWQVRLARKVLTDGAWPKTLDLPTGTGKTATLDIAVYHLAAQAGARGRTAPLRVVYIVDRRTLVDQAYQRATGLAARLEASETGILGEVREALEGYRSGRGRPLEVTLLRGGIPRSDTWARQPDQPLLVVSTVDQVGSRLLFRGYGVSASMRPIHAGLLGNDVLFLLDEVHLSAPFCETLEHIRTRYRAWGETPLPSPFGAVQMSATPGRHEAAFGLEDSDWADPLLRRRLQSSKPTRRVAVPGSKFVPEVEKNARELAAPPGSTILVVVNRVDSARRVAAGLKDLDVRLVTGRMRPLDRERMESELLPRVRAGRHREPGLASMVVVATQCIEAGADFDFEGLVTECASLDALRQRFGRLDRLGELGSAPAVVVASNETLKNDPVYGTALGATWEWLQGQGEIDFGVAHLPQVNHSEAEALLAPRRHAPVLLPAHLDFWTQTSPAPQPDPDVALWLHGPDSGTADCQVVWRADLEEDLLEDPTLVQAALSLVDAVPPSTGEAVSVPFAAVSRWLRGLSERGFSDVEGAADGEQDERGRARPCVLWRGDESVVARAETLEGLLRPGDTVVVPSTYGGLYQGTWDPGCSDPVRDLGDLASFRLRGRAALRLEGSVLHSLTGDPTTDPPRLASDEEEPGDEKRAIASWLRTAAERAWPADVLELVHALAAAGPRLVVDRIEVPGREPAVVVRSRRRFRLEGGEATSEDDSSSFIGVPVPLKRHLAGVARRAGDFALRAGLPQTVVEDLRLAALLHDVGKADVRFQRLLHGGSAFRASLATEPLAKSGRLSARRDERARAAARSGYPAGARHEVQSVALLDGSTAMVAAHDPDLVLHLVASHHGRCRPFAPWVEDPLPVEISLPWDGATLRASSDHGLARLDSGVGERFWLLVRRYGWWGLAWLEALLRLADHLESEQEQERERLS